MARTAAGRVVLDAHLVREVFHALHRRYGPQCWWPGESPFEVVVGAVLTQNTAWTNVERAIDRLKAANLLHPQAILDCPEAVLGERLRPSGYFNVKARRLRNLCAFWLEAGGEAGLEALPTATLRTRLLGVNGIGPETADDMLLYAFQRPVFVVDAYTRRLFQRLHALHGQERYEQIRAGFEGVLGPDLRTLNEYHALIVRHGKTVCRTRPRCFVCCLAACCPSAG